jgi:hypothetical protein
VVDGEDLRVAAPVTDTASSALVPVPRASAPAIPAAEFVEQTSRTVLGVVLIAIDGITRVVEQASTTQVAAPPSDEPGLMVSSRRVAVGLAFASQRRILGGLDTAGRVVGPSVRWLASNPLLQTMSSPLQRQLDAAYEAGLAEEERARVVAGASGEQAVQLAVPVVLDRVDVDQLVDQILGAIDIGPLVERVIGGIDLGPVIETVMSELDMSSLVEGVMSELDLGPIIEKVMADLDLPSLVNEVVGEMQMSSVVMQATGGMTSEVLGEVRNRSADGDALVERMIAKVLRRRLGQLPPTSGLIEETEP